MTSHESLDPHDTPGADAPPRHTVLLGGIGGDAHSVGLSILRRALQVSGYTTIYLGIQNQLEEFFRWAPRCSAVLVSNMDGHASHYLRAFPELRMQQQARATHEPLWYLGGNIHVLETPTRVRELLAMGFARVFPRFVDVEAVLEMLARDLAGKQPPCLLLDDARAPGETAVFAARAVSDEPLDRRLFDEQRRAVLAEWRTGPRAADLADNARFLRAQPSFARVQALVRMGERPILVQPRCGVALVEGQLEMFRRFKLQGASVLSYQVDSLTRLHNYAGAEEELRASQALGTSTINGFPMINHGVDVLRRMIATIGVPLQTRHSTRDPRLLAEISYAGGVTSFEGGAIGYNIPYFKDYSLEDAIQHWQYVDRLTGLYHEEFGLVLDREFFGPLTATLIPPSLALVAVLVEAVLAVRQGVKSVSLGYGEQGHRAQDIAAVRTLRQLADELLHNLGHHDVQVSTVFHQYMAAFPESYPRAEELIEQSGITAGLAGATRIIAKSPVEALRIPALADNLRGVQLATRGAELARGVAPDEAQIAREAAWLRAEVDDILVSLLGCGSGSFARGLAEGFRRGYLDIPFAPSIYNRGLVVAARDIDGAVRFLDTGRLQLRRELQDFHRDRMQDRMHAEGLQFDRHAHVLIERDVMRIPRGQYEQWPLG